MDDDLMQTVNMLDPKESLASEEQNVLAGSPAVQSNIDMPTASTPQPEAADMAAPDSEQTRPDVARVPDQPEVITMDNPNYIGSNEKYNDVIPYKLNIFGQDITTKSIDPHKIAYELATQYNGLPTEDFFGYYYAPPIKETWVSAALKGALGQVLEIPSWFDSMAGAIADLGLEGTGYIDVPTDPLEKRLYDANKDQSKYLTQLSNWLKRGFDVDKYIDDSMATQISGAVGSVFGSMGLFLVAKGMTAIPSIMMNSGAYDHIKKSNEDKGHSALYSTGMGLAGWASVSALDVIGANQFTRAFRQISKHTAKGALKNVSAKATEAKLLDKSMDELVKKASRTDDQVFWKGFTRGVISTTAETGTEEGQKVIEDLFAGEVGKGYFEDNLDEFIVTGVSSLLAVGALIPLEVRKTQVEHKFAKSAVGGYAGNLLKLKQARAQFYNKLVGAGWDEKIAEAYIDDVIVNGVEHAKALVPDALSSLLASVDPADVQDLQEKLKATNFENVAKQKFKELDDRVVAALEGIEDLSESDKLLIRAGYQGIANWLSYFGAGPDSVIVPTFTTDASLAGADAEAVGSFSGGRNVFYIQKRATSEESKYIESIVQKENIKSLDEETGAKLLKKLKRKFGAKRGQVLYDMMRRQYFGAKSVSPFDIFVSSKEFAGQTVSERMKTIIHELAHNLDWAVLETHGIKEKDLDFFLDSYLSVIERVFGEENANWVDTMLNDPSFGIDEQMVASEDGLVDFGEAAIAENEKEDYAKSNRGFRGYKTGKGENEYTSARNSTEWFAQAMGRLAKEAAEGLGLKGRPAVFVQLANAILEAQDNVGMLTKPFEDYLAEFKKMVADNSALVKAMAKHYGPEKLNGFMQRLAEGGEEVEGISLDDMKSLLTMAESYVDAEAGQQLNDIFKDVSLPKVKDAIDGLEMFNTALSMSDQKGKETVSAVDAKTEDILSDRGTQVSMDLVMTVQEETDAENKATGKTPFQRQVETKVDGKTLQEDIEYVSDVLNKEEDRTPLGRFYKWLLGMADRFGISEFVRAIGGKEMEDRFGLIAKHEALDDITYAKHERFANRVQKEVLGLDKTKDANASAKLQQFEMECSLKKHEVDYADPRDGHVSKRKLSVFELMMIHLVSKQDKRMTDPNGLEVGLSPKERLQKSLPNQSIDELVKLLTPEQKKYADIMQEEMGEAFQSFISSFEDAGLGTKFATVENYWPLLDAMAQAEGKDNTNWTIARDAFATSAIGIMDAREQFNRYIARVASFESGFYAAIGRLKDVFFYTPRDIGSTNEADQKLASDLTNRSKRAQAAMERRIGKKASGTFNELLKDFLNPRAENLLNDSIVAKISRNLTAKILSWKPIQLLKASTNFFSFWGLAENQGQYWADTVEGLANPVETWKFMIEHSPQIKKRLRGLSYSEFLNSITAGGDNLLAVLAKEGAERNSKILSKSAPALANFIALSNVMKKYGLSPMLMGDAFSNVYGGYALYKQYLRKYNGNAEMATRAFDEAIVRKQASSNQAMKSLKQRQWNRSLAGAALAFTSEGMAKWNDIIINIEQAHEGEISKGEATKAVLSDLAPMIAFALLSIGVTDLLFGDDEEKEEAQASILPEIISQISGGHLLGNAIIAPAINQFLLGGRQSVSVPVAGEFLRLMSEANKGELDDVGLRAVSAAGLFLGAENLLSDFAGVGRAVTAEDRKERQAGIAQAEGRSKGWAERREGIKKTVEKDSEK